MNGYLKYAKETSSIQKNHGSLMQLFVFINATLIS